MNINILAPINNLSYGIVSKNIIKELIKSNNTVSLWPIGNNEFETVEERELIRSCVSNNANFDNSAPSLRIWHQFEMAQHIGKGLHCGLPIFELDRFTNREINHLASLDKIFVCSQWAKEVVLKSMNDNYRQWRGSIEVKHSDNEVIVSPLGVNTNIFSYNEEYRPCETWTTFITIGKWEIRKGHHILIHAFNAAFKPSDRVRLIMLTYNPFLKEEYVKEWYKQCELSNMSSKIECVKHYVSQLDLIDIIRNADCGVFPTHAEGWGLPILEMLAMGKEVITTNYSGQTEFCNHNNAHLIEVDKMEDANDGIWFNGYGQWAKIGPNQVDQLIGYMRDIHIRKQNGDNLVNLAGIETAKKFSWKNTALTILRSLV